MIPALAATLAIVVQDHTSLRSAPQSSSAELTTLWQGDVLEIRGEREGYLKVYNYRRERGGYIKSGSARQVGLTETDAAELLAQSGAGFFAHDRGYRRNNACAVARP